MQNPEDMYNALMSPNGLAGYGRRENSNHEYTYNVYQLNETTKTDVKVAIVYYNSQSTFSIRVFNDQREINASFTNLKPGRRGRRNNDVFKKAEGIFRWITNNISAGGFVIDRG